MLSRLSVVTCGILPEAPPGTAAGTEMPLKLGCKVGETTLGPEVHSSYLL